MADEEAEVGSMTDSTILVRVVSRFAGRKFFTPEIRPSKFVPREPGKRSVRRDESEEKPRKRSVDVCCGAGAEGAEESIVMRVISRTLVDIS